MRTTVMLDDELVARAKRVWKIDSTSDLLERSLREMLRRESLSELADALGSDDKMTAAPRRRPA